MTEQEFKNLKDTVAGLRNNVDYLVEQDNSHGKLMTWVCIWLSLLSILLLAVCTYQDSRLDVIHKESKEEIKRVDHHIADVDWAVDEKFRKLKRSQEVIGGSTEE